MNSLRGRRGLVTTPSPVSLVLWLAFGAGTSLSSCASDPSSDGGDVEGSGTLGVKLQVAPGITLLTVSYSITGNGFTKAGSIDVGDSPKITANIGGIPAGSGYTIALTANSVQDGTQFKALPTST
jgi:hypothetical protein